MIYLYVKQHAITKLLYFGKTKRDPYAYNGSGLYWKRHLQKHGSDVHTLHVWKFNSLEECNAFANEYSAKNNIVESAEWANLKPENGLDGGFLSQHGEHSSRFKGKKHTEEMKEQRSILYSGAGNPNYGKTHTKEAREKMSIKSKNRQLTRPKSEIEAFAYCNIGKKQSKEHILKRTQHTKGRFAIVNKEGVVRYTKNKYDERLLSGEFIKGKLWFN